MEGGPPDAAIEYDKSLVERITNVLRVTPEFSDKVLEGIWPLVEEFVERNREPALANHRRTPNPDEQHGIARLLQWLSEQDRRSADRAELLLDMWKILLRKPWNRVPPGEDAVDGPTRTQDDVLPAHVRGFPDAGLDTLRSLLRGPPSLGIACEACNIVLNLCFDRRNIARVASADIPPAVIAHIDPTNPDLAAAAAGAVQSVAFQSDGRAVFRTTEVVPRLGRALRTLGVRDTGEADEESRRRDVSAMVGSLLRQPKTLRLVQRLVGALHNLSSDPVLGVRIRDEGMLPSLVALLHVPVGPLCSSVMGLLQNVAREAAAREELSRTEAIPLLSRFLLSPHTATQVSAAGALYNILAGPHWEAGEETEGEILTTLRSVLSDGIALGASLPVLTAAGASSCAGLWRTWDATDASTVEDEERSPS